MNATIAKVGFYVTVLLTPLVTHASNSEQERKQPSIEEIRRVQEIHRAHVIHRYFSSYRNAEGKLPIAAVPEPGSLALMGAGIVGLVLARRSKR